MPFPNHPFVGSRTPYGGATPQTIMGANLVGWWNADDTARITIATGVSNWTDSIGSYALAQATPGLQPAYVNWAGAVQAKGAQFDAADDFLRLGSTPGTFPLLTNTSEVWVLASQDLPSGTAGSLCSFGYGSLTTNTRLVRRTVSGSNRAGVNAQGTSATNTSVDYSGRHYVRAQFVNSAIQADVDGVAGTPAVAVLATATGNTTMGATTATVAAGFFGGIIAQVLVLDTTPSAGQITALNAYFAARL